jgi:hypothetical protein
MSPRIHKMFAAAAAAVVVLAVAWGFVLVGSPLQRRQERLDERRLDDLRTIEREIRSMVLDPHDSGKLKEKLPKTLEEAARGARNERINLRDPESGEPYRYTVKSDKTYELCATFARSRDSDSQVFWNHAAGSACFTINVLNPPPD